MGGSPAQGWNGSTFATLDQLIKSDIFHSRRLFLFGTLEWLLWVLLLKVHLHRQNGWLHADSLLKLFAICFDKPRIRLKPSSQ